ncbi:MAG: ribbon-helix-helix protein, CopG family [Pseudonocardiaceae bacterium]
MRTTLRVDDELLRRAKSHAARQGRSLTSVFEEALRRLLAESERHEERTRVELPVSVASGGVLPGVDLDDSAALLDVMEGRAPS